MQSQPNTHWAGIIQHQQLEKRQFDQQQKIDSLQRKQKYKQELETDIILKQRKQLQSKQHEQSLESETLATLLHREQKKLKELEQRRMQEIETSLENLNNQLIKKKMTQERTYQAQLTDQQKILKDKLKEVRSHEKQKLNKEQDQMDLRENYENMIQFKLNQKQLQIQNRQSLQQPYYRDQSENLHMKSHYKDDLNNQLEEKKIKLQQLHQKKQEERLKIEQKIAFEQQKMLENKIKDYQVHKQYEQDNLQLLIDNKVKQVPMSKLNNQDLRFQWQEVNNKQTLPHIYCDNYQPPERAKQLQLIDKDLQKYQNQQQNIVSNPMKQTPIKTPLSQSSKNSKSLRQVGAPVITHQDVLQEGYAKIHSSKTQTPKSSISKKSVGLVSPNDLKPQAIPKYKSYNILTGQLNIF